MLILSRKVDESIVFEGLGIEVMVCAIDRGRVRLGVTAPDGVKILRHELLERMDPWVIQQKPKELGNGVEIDAAAANVAAGASGAVERVAPRAADGTRVDVGHGAGGSRAVPNRAR